MTNILAKQRSDRVKFGIFISVAAVLTGYLVLVTGEIRWGQREEYRAVFGNISGLREGDQVRVASVPAGRVKKVDVQRDNTVLVTFDLDSDIELNRSSTATVRYRNLIGDRFLELARPDAGAEALKPGATITADQTFSALDLDTLLNGFKPLFVGLNAQQINELSVQLVRVLQGQQGAISTLLSTLGRVTQNVGNRQQLVSQVIKNLDTVLGTIDDRRETLGTLIDQMTGLVEGLEKQDTQVLSAAGQIEEFAQDATTLLARARVDLTPTLSQLETATSQINENADTLDLVLGRLPDHYALVQQSASYGNFFNFFLCGLRLQLTDESGGKPIQTPWIRSDLERCS